MTAFDDALEERTAAQEAWDACIDNGRPSQAAEERLIRTQATLANLVVDMAHKALSELPTDDEWSQRWAR